MSSTKPLKRLASPTQGTEHPAVEAGPDGDREHRQARMDAEMRRYNIWAAQGISVADEYGTL